MRGRSIYISIAVEGTEGNDASAFGVVHQLVLNHTYNHQLPCLSLEANRAHLHCQRHILKSLICYPVLQEFTAFKARRTEQGKANEGDGTNSVR